MTDKRTPGPIFKIGAHYLRTMVDPDGQRRVHPGDLRKAFPPGEAAAAGPQDPEVLKFLAWMRAGTTPPVSPLTVKKIPFAIQGLERVAVKTALDVGDEVMGANLYCALFDVLAAFGLSGEEGREYVECRALLLSAPHTTDKLEEMLVSWQDLRSFVTKTGCQLAPTVRN